MPDNSQPLVDDSPNPAFHSKNSYEYKNRFISHLNNATNKFFSVIWNAGRRIKTEEQSTLLLPCTP